MEKKHTRKRLSTVARIILSFLFAIFLFFLGAIAIFSFVFSELTVYRSFFTKMVFAAWAGSLLLLVGWCLASRRVVRLGVVVLLLSAAGCVMGVGWFWWTFARFPYAGRETINWSLYRPFSKGNLLVHAAAAPEQKMTLAELPRIDGAYAFYPVYAAAVQALLTEPPTNRLSTVGTHGSDFTFRRLLDGSVDLIVSLAPSERQLQDAAEKGLTYEMTPFAREAFVFFVNRKNPVGSVSSEAIRGIYSGRITDWRDVGAEKSARIIPFQRNEGSGSQTMLQRIMRGTPIMPPPKEDRIGGMLGIINDTARYRNYTEALGFSFRYYVEGMARNPEIKLLAIDGIAPTPENIANGTYPFIATCYIITVRPRSEGTQKFIDFMLSPSGREIIEKTGYVAR